MAEDERELAYYHAIEDLFAALRGVPHLLSPKDFQLMRLWWREEVPLGAVRTGITEVFARRRERGQDEPVVSLGYCRHAVRRHARRMAEMRVGAQRDETLLSPARFAESLHNLAQKLAAAAARARSTHPAVAAVVERIMREVEECAALPPGELEAHLFALESALLGACLEAVDPRTRAAIERRARAEASAVNSQAEERAFRALRDRLLRERFALPRLELEP